MELNLSHVNSAEKASLKNERWKSISSPIPQFAISTVNIVAMAAKLSLIWGNITRWSITNMSKYLYLTYSFYKCSICDKHFNLKSDYCFHLKEHNIKQDKTKLNFFNFNSVNNNCSVETDYSVTSRMEYVIVNEIQFGVYVIKDKY